MDVFQILTCSMILVHDCLSFNVDFEHAVTFSGPQNSLFGYNSVLQSNRFVVTAPKGNQSSNPDLISPGTIYRCPVNFDNQNGPSCEQVSIRTSDLPRFQNNQFLGGSVVKINDGTVVCAHLAKYPRNDILFQIVSGRCHLIDISLSRVDPNKVYNSVFSGMAGFSGAAVKNGSYSVLGAPGLENEGRGGFVTELWLGSDTARKTFMAKDFSNINTFLHQSYLGYSIGIGQFPKLGTCVKSPILLGSPRFASVEGHVGSVILICETSSSVVILKQYFGDQIGSGFGYSISACDYNGDNIDDLIVAAPFFEENKESTDGGRVYVFRGTGDRDYLEATNATLKVDIVASGRFGTAMACLGDINADQLNDLAISAPYDGEGVIYIFNGKRDMINTVYSQKIYGRNVDPGIRTFGLHISQQLADVDDNKYRDFTVGSALSNKLTLLRSRPVVSITPLVTLQHTMIPLNSSGEGCEDPLSITPCTTMTICFSFSEHLDGKVGVVDVSYQINVDVDRVKSRRQSRVHIVQNSTVYRNTFVNQNYILRKRQTHCESVLLRVTSFDRHFFASLEVPLKIEMNYSLNEVSRGMEILPILNPASDNKVERTVRFQTGCEGHCLPDLMIDTQMEPAVIVYGESEYLEYTITLTNSGEPALAPSITVVTSHRSPFVAQRTDLQAGSVRVSCQQLPDNITVNCECGNVLYINQLAKFSLIYDVSADSILPDGMNITDITDIVISATASATGGVDANQDDNSVRSVVPVELHSDVRPTGNSVPDQAIISDDRVLLSLEHKYEILNIGPSPMIGASILVQLPSYMDGQVILDYNSVRVTPNINTTDCEIIFRNRSNSDTPPATNSPTASPAPFVLVDIDVTCNLDCVSVQCRVYNIDVDEFSTISISFDIHAQQLNFEGASSLNYISKGFISPVTTDLPFRLLNNGSLEVTSVLYPQKTKEIVEPLNLWIIVGGSLGGVALLVILFAVMWKVGFFKRDKKKVIEEYKRKSNFYENRKTQRLEAARSKALSKVMSRSDEIILHEK